MKWPWARQEAPRLPVSVITKTPPPRKARAPIATGGPIADYLAALLAELRAIKQGAVATYIPELAKADPDLCAIALATADGALYVAGDADHAFTIQSVSKPFLYAAMLDAHGRDYVLKRVGVEPTGDAFNALKFDEEHKRPFNPMVNAGAIGVAAMVPGKSVAARIERVRAGFSRFAGRKLAIDEIVMDSEKETGDRNRAIAAAMFQGGMIDGEPEDILDIYFAQCSVLTTCRDLALMGATLANDGVQPVTGERVLRNETVCDVLSVMNTCGMYNYAGQWAYEVGMPAKSGVSGAILAVIPGQAGLAIFSPPIDERGNSVRAIAGCKRVAAEFGLHVFRTNPSARSVIRRVVRGDVLRSKRMRTRSERALLDAAGAEICVIEAQDVLYFGSTELLLREANRLAQTARTLILDLRRVYAADDAARRLLAELALALRAAGRKLVFAHVEAEGALADLHAALKATLGDVEDIAFAHRDEALEACENEIIARSKLGAAPAKFGLAHLDLFRGLDGEAVKALEAAAKPLAFEAGQIIVKEGDLAQLFFVLISGTASVRLNVDGAGGGAHKVRVASVGPGMSFGEMALLDGGVRSADVVADERVVCYGFSVEELIELGRAHPQILIVVFGNMTRDLSERLRRTTDEVRALEH
ncbi:MAG: glutaminase A [Terricaulis silvestris]